MKILCLPGRWLLVKMVLQLKWVYAQVVLCSLSFPLLGIYMGPPVTISQDPKGGFSPIALTRNSATAVAVFQKLDPSTSIQASIYSGGSWGSPNELGLLTSYTENYSMDMNNGGNAIAVWSSYKSGGEVVRYSMYNPITHLWSVDQPLSAVDEVSAVPDVALNSSNNALACWSQPVSGTHYEVAMATFYSAALAVWSSPQAISPATEGAEKICLALNDGGDAVAAWTAYQDTATVIRAAQFHSGVWSPSTVISSPLKGSDEVQVMIDTLGNAVAVWTTIVPGTGLVFQSSTLTSGVWSSYATVISEINGGDCSFVMNSAGQGAIGWETLVGGYWVSRVMVLSGGVWSSPVTLSSPTENAANTRLAINNLNQVAAIWTANDNSTEVAVNTAGTWSAPYSLSCCCPCFKNHSVSMNDVGDILVVLDQLSSTGSSVCAMSGTLTKRIPIKRKSY